MSTTIHNMCQACIVEQYDIDLCDALTRVDHEKIDTLIRVEHMWTRAKINRAMYSLTKKNIFDGINYLFPQKFLFDHYELLDILHGAIQCEYVDILKSVVTCTFMEHYNNTVEFGEGPLTTDVLCYEIICETIYSKKEYMIDMFIELIPGFIDKSLVTVYKNDNILVLNYLVSAGYDISGHTCIPCGNISKYLETLQMLTTDIGACDINVKHLGHLLTNKYVKSMSPTFMIDHDHSGSTIVSRNGQPINLSNDTIVKCKTAGWIFIDC